ncbi:amidohydrolase family protein [candidate division KSB1 bacterium]
MKKIVFGIVLSSLVIFCTNLPDRAEIREFDIVIMNGHVIDGTGNPWYKADVGVKDGKIAKIGNLAVAERDKTIDATGLIVSPGFIDFHNHSDNEMLTHPKAENYIRQGVTTLFIGHCGSSTVPSEDYPTFNTYFSQIEKQGIAPNIAVQIGHGTLRGYVIGGEDRDPTAEELEEMKEHVAGAIEEGAYGLSTGLVYFPGMYAKTDEIIELCKVVTEYDGIYTTHVRDDGAHWEEAVLEALEISEKSGVRLQVVHNETHYPNWGKLDMIMNHIEDARNKGMLVSCDVIPTLCGSQGLNTVFPNWALEGGTAGLIVRLKNPEERAQIRNYVLNEKDKHTSPSSTLIADGYAEKIWIEGKHLEDWARERGQHPVDAAMDMIIEKNGSYGIILEFHNEDDICDLIRHPLASIVSDGSVEPFGEGTPHPRSYGCFPLVFRKYVRGETRSEEPREVGRKILSLPEAVRKITSCPAQRLRLRDRGLLREGMWADITIFDPETISDQATYANPHQYPVGIPYVLVNGEIVVENSAQTENLPGEILRGPRYSR